MDSTSKEEPIISMKNRGKPGNFEYEFYFWLAFGGACLTLVSIVPYKYSV